MRYTVFSRLICPALILLSLGGCYNARHITYFMDFSDSLTREVTVPRSIPPLIEPDDIVNIKVYTLDPTATSTINNSGISVTTIGSATLPGSAAATVVSGYLVDRNGDVELPEVGKVNLKGLTTIQARTLLEEKFSFVLKNPTVNVNIANFRISILGQVTRPSTYVISTESLTILEAIAYAGDLTSSGRRDNILIIRNENGKKRIGRINLNSSSIFKSEFYFLQKNDIVYVEPTRAAKNNLDKTNTQSWVAFGASLATLVLSIYAISRIN
jgi:polysaccharide export outer membrane protein